MASRDLAIGMTFLTQTVTGILANIVLLFHYLSLCFSGYMLRPTDLIAEHLTIANTLIMLSKGVSQTVQAFGIKYFSQGIICTVLFYVYRVARGVSVSTTCLLSVFQTVKISPMNSSWKQLKAKLPKHISFSIFLIWSLYTLVNGIFPFYRSHKYSGKNITKKKEYGFCSTGFRDKIIEALYAAFILFPEVSFSGIMIWSSGSMIFILHRHKQQVQYILRTNVSHKSSPESRATQSVLVLVCTFVSFYTLSSIFYACVLNFNIPSWWLMNTSDLISTCFPAVSPFVLMSCNSTASRLWFKFSSFVRSMQSAFFCTKVSG
ncbi:PREDICTED: vomeronasal type-1 receptor 4-like [Chinchilla lanigera]|uniref:vomeronasal type-1 receptor 4-like n=1 Tax=Chinchilla lanigera TaxID=34839 RepID=UPI00069801D5|nr:PREDICTED: vomeronasal type-1 receptor 4-like [Chinchilla lanigera]